VPLGGAPPDGAGTIEQGDSAEEPEGQHVGVSSGESNGVCLTEADPLPLLYTTAGRWQSDRSCRRGGRIERPL
jgi:hypothetical protein